MSEFNLSIRLGNDAMQTGRDVAEALRKAADRVESTHDDVNLDDWNGLSGGIRDLNGASVGRWEVTPA